MYLKKVIVILFIITTSYASSQKSNGNILIVTSNQHTYGNTAKNTANHFAEIVLAYHVFIENGYDVHFTSPKGGAIPLGYISTSDSIQKMYLYNNDFMNTLKNTLHPSKINPSQYDAVYYSGGGSAMFGVPNNVEIKNIAESIYYENGIISAVCHGTAGITNLKTKTGDPIYKDKQVSGYPDIFENKDAEYYKTFPFSIEEKIRENNGTFLYSNKKNANFYVVDGNLITGQDPSSTTSVALKVIEALQTTK